MRSTGMTEIITLDDSEGDTDMTAIIIPDDSEEDTEQFIFEIENKPPISADNFQPCLDQPPASITYTTDSGIDPLATWLAESGPTSSLESSCFEVAWRQYSCMLCPKAYRHVGHFERHLRMKHGVHTINNAQNRLNKMKMSRLVVEPEPEKMPPSVVEPEPEKMPPSVVEPEPEKMPPSVVEPEPEKMPPSVVEPEPERGVTTGIPGGDAPVIVTLGSINCQVSKKELPEVCTFCNESFDEAASYRRHMASHLSVELHQCVECHKLFNNNRQLNFHMKIHSVRCGICQRTFSKRAYKSHVNKSECSRKCLK